MSMDADDLGPRVYCARCECILTYHEEEVCQSCAKGRTTTPRRWWRVWVRADDPPRHEDTLRIFATDEHAIYKQCASEGRQVTACVPEYHHNPNGDFGPEEE